MAMKMTVGMSSDMSAETRTMLEYDVRQFGREIRTFLEIAFERLVISESMHADMTPIPFLHYMPV